MIILFSRFIAAIFILLVLSSGCSRAPDFTHVEDGEMLSGGATTFQKINPDVSLSRESYSQAAVNLSIGQRNKFALGNAFFTAPWQPESSAESSRTGLGPLFNAAACQDCHIRDGRGHPPTESLSESSVLRVALANGEPDPVYGHQIQTRALPGLLPEAVPVIYWQNSSVALAGGETISMRKPFVVLEQLHYGPLADGHGLSLRVAPAMIGLGLLESIAANAILAGEDVGDSDGDGISGRANRVWSQDSSATVIGRFGWKAGQPSIRQQSLLAFQQDIGISSQLYPYQPCTSVQADCLASQPSIRPELSDEIEEVLLFYASHLAVPARRWHDRKEVLAGKALFHTLGCAACHQPSWRTARLDNHPVLSEQLIWPYTDMLLHDMGEGLADGVIEFGAQGSEWRTAPLWGVHLAKAVGGAAVGFLHDGRARDFKEAIMWHGGEAQASRDAWASLKRDDREKLIWFLKSL